MATDVVLLDLDETLIVEQASDRSSFEFACGLAHDRFGVDPERMYQAIGRESERLWRQGSYCKYCDGLGIASWEGLWGEFSGEYPNFPDLGRWIGTFKVQSWTAALASCDSEDPDFATELSAAFQQHRRSNHAPFPDMYDVLTELSRGHSLAMVTNGVPDIQWCKIKALGIEKYFEAIVISGELGIGKPDPRIFTHTLEQLHSTPDRAVMVGNSLGRDVQGAKNAGIRSIWLKTDDPEPATAVSPDHEITSLMELPRLL